MPRQSVRTISSLRPSMAARSSSTEPTRTPWTARACLRLVEFFARFEEGLAGDAADAEAGAAQELVLIDAGDVQAELGGGRAAT